MRQIGEGGMGSVWLATHLGLGIPCAIKFVEGEWRRQPEMVARFEREAKVEAQLRSPHVVHVLDHGVWNGTPYIAMEFMEGGSIAKGASTPPPRIGSSRTWRARSRERTPSASSTATSNPKTSSSFPATTARSPRSSISAWPSGTRIGS